MSVPSDIFRTYANSGSMAVQHQLSADTIRANVISASQHVSEIIDADTATFVTLNVTNETVENLQCNNGLLNTILVNQASVDSLQNTTGVIETLSSTNAAIHSLISENLTVHDVGTIVHLQSTTGTLGSLVVSASTILNTLSITNTGASALTVAGSGTISTLSVTDTGASALTVAGSGTISTLSVTDTGASALTVAGSGTISTLSVTDTGASALTVAGSGTISTLSVTDTGASALTVAGTIITNTINPPGGSSDTLTLNGAAITDGKISSDAFPLIAITNVYTANNEAEQLALNVSTQEGDICVRTDENKSYIRNSGSTGTMSDWTLLNTPTDAVLSVNGKLGVVLLSTTDIPEGDNLYFTNTRARSALSVGTNGLTYNSGTGIFDVVQNVTTAGQPQFSGLTVTSLLTDGLVKTNASGVLGNVSLGSGLNYVTGTLSNSGVLQIIGTANQITASASTGNVTLSLPSSVSLGSLTITSLLTDGLLKTNASGVVGNATIGSSLSYSAGTLNTIQGLTTGSSPNFTGLSIGNTGASNSTLTIISSPSSENFIRFSDGTNAAFIQYSHVYDQFLLIVGGGVNQFRMDASRSWIPNNIPFSAYNAAGGAYINMIKVNTSDAVELNDGKLTIDSGTNIYMHPNGAGYVNVNGWLQAGDSSNVNEYGKFQVTRPFNQGDTKFHISMIRNGSSVFGAGFLNNSDVVGFQYTNTSSAQGLFFSGNHITANVGTTVATLANTDTSFTIRGDPFAALQIGFNYPTLNAMYLQSKYNGTTNGLQLQPLGGPTFIGSTSLSYSDMYLTCSDSGNSTIYFDGATAGYRGYIRYNQHTASPSKTMVFGTNGSDRMSIDSGGTISTANNIELGTLGTGDRYSILDFHSSGTPQAIDYSARMLRNPGVNGAFYLQNAGSGSITLQALDNAYLYFHTNAVERMSIDPNGKTTITQAGAGSSYGLKIDYPGVGGMQFYFTTAGQPSVIRDNGGAGFNFLRSDGNSICKINNDGDTRIYNYGSGEMLLAGYGSGRTVLRSVSGNLVLESKNALGIELDSSGNVTGPGYNVQSGACFAILCPNISKSITGTYSQLTGHTAVSSSNIDVSVANQVTITIAGMYRLSLSYWGYMVSAGTGYVTIYKNGSQLSTYCTTVLDGGSPNKNVALNWVCSLAVNDILTVYVKTAGTSENIFFGGGQFVISNL